MARWGWLLAATATAVAAILPAPAAAQTDLPAPDVVRADVVEIVPEGDAAIVYEGRRYGGTMRVGGHPSGLALVESVDLDGYLAGIQEVPFSWETEALRAQVIAARTYLAWTLSQGRTSDGTRYDYDICATDACQVYAGLEPTLAEGGARWLAAVESTDSEILVYEGSPALAYYSSTSGGRTRTVTDVWPDRDGLPYLEAVESPGEDSPFASWSWWLGEATMERVLAEAGLIDGDLLDVTTTVTDDGQGPWTVTIESEGAVRTLTTWELRSYLNRAGPAAAPELLPASRPDGPRYPQTILSPTYTIRPETVRIPALPGLGPLTVYVVEGAGWGHQVGMSQYGAQAMAEQGASASQILAHFYGGLEPRPAPESVPDTVEVALATEVPAVELGATGPVTVIVDGRTFATDELGSWTMEAVDGSVELTAPVGLGLPPEIDPGRVGFDGFRPVLRPEVTVAATVRWRVEADGRVVESFGPRTIGPGPFEIPVPLGADEVRLTIRATNKHGGTFLTVEVP